MIANTFLATRSIFMLYSCPMFSQSRRSALRYKRCQKETVAMILSTWRDNDMRLWKSNSIDEAIVLLKNSKLISQSGESSRTIYHIPKTVPNNRGYFKIACHLSSVHRDLDWFWNQNWENGLRSVLLLDHRIRFVNMPFVARKLRRLSAGFYR